MGTVMAALIALLMTGAPSGRALTAAERHFFGRQLEIVVAAVRGQLESQGVSCNAATLQGGAVSSDAADWVSPNAIPGTLPLEPASWTTFLRCVTRDEITFRMGVSLHGSPVFVPTTQVLESGEDFLVRDASEGTTVLIVGKFVTFDPHSPLPTLAGKADGGPAHAVAALIAVEAVSAPPPRREIFRMLGKRVVFAALLDAASAAQPGNEAGH
jgi:hypothetical protein